MDMDYYFEYDEENEFGDDDLLGEEYFSHNHHQSLADTWSSCVHPSFVQITAYIATFYLWNLLFVITTQIGTFFVVVPSHPRCLMFVFTVTIPTQLRNCSAIVCGTCMLYFTTGSGVVNYFAFIAFILLIFRVAVYVRVKRFGALMMAACIGALVLGYNNKLRFYVIRVRVKEHFLQRIIGRRP